MPRPAQAPSASCSEYAPTSAACSVNSNQRSSADRWLWSAICWVLHESVSQSVAVHRDKEQKTSGRSARRELVTQKKPEVMELGSFATFDADRTDIVASSVISIASSSFRPIKVRANWAPCRDCPAF